MKKAILILLILTMACFTACTKRAEPPEIDENVTVEQALKETNWAEYDMDKIMARINVGWEDEKPSDIKYAMLSTENRDDRDVALVCFRDTHENDDDYDYLLRCPGVCLGSGTIRDGETYVFEDIPIGNPDGKPRDLHIGYSKDGWFDINGTKTECDEDKTVAWTTE